MAPGSRRNLGDDQAESARVLSERALATLRLHRGEGGTVAVLVAIAFLAEAGMKEEEGRTVGLAPFGIAELPAVSKSDR